MLLGATAALGAQKPFLAPKTHFGAQNALLCSKVTFGAKSAFLGLGDPKSVTFLKAKSKVSEQGAHKVDFGSTNGIWPKKSLLGPKKRKIPQNAFFALWRPLGATRPRSLIKQMLFCSPKGSHGLQNHFLGPKTVFGPKIAFWTPKRTFWSKSDFWGRKCVF